MVLSPFRRLAEQTACITKMRLPGNFNQFPYGKSGANIINGFIFS